MKFIVIWALVIAALYYIVSQVSTEFLTEDEIEILDDIQEGDVREGGAGKERVLTPWEQKAKEARERQAQ